jgi:ferredoxin
MSETQQALRTAAAELLAAGEVGVVIGYEAGTQGRRRPFFARSEADAARLVYDDSCWHNLATYLTKNEVRHLGRIAIVGSPAALRSLLRLAAERQVREGEVVALAVGEDAGVRKLASLADVRAHLEAMPDRLHPAARAEIERLSAATAAERRAFWHEQLARCIKCYACRTVCPMCYCERCTTDCNRPQWIPVASHGLGNLEYHLMRAMHLAGRCVQCGNCVRACPLGISVPLLAVYAEESVRRQFGSAWGGAAGGEYALSTFRPDDKEAFIR